MSLGPGQVDLGKPSVTASDHHLSSFFLTHHIHFEYCFVLLTMKVNSSEGVSGNGNRKCRQVIVNDSRIWQMILGVVLGNRNIK